METTTSITKKLSSLVNCDFDDLVTSVSSNSNNVTEGGLFVAIKGAKTNGEDFIGSAIASGARYIVKQGVRYKVYRKGDCVFIETPDPQGELAKICNKFYDNSIQYIAAVTGTNGKTSTSDFLKQIWRYSGFRAASIGTLGVLKDDEQPTGNQAMTSPDPLSLNKALHALGGEGINHVVIEASSHGLEQKRVLGLNFKVVAFTNLTQDHLDYHKSMRNYFMAKSRLFTKEYISADTKCVINIDSDKYPDLAKICYGPIITYGIGNGDFCFRKIEISEHGYDVVMSCLGVEYKTTVNILSHFQLYNILCASAMAYACGMDVCDIIKVIPKLRDVKGRMQYVGSYNGGKIYVDYAHTPDGLENAISDVKSHTQNRTVVLFGCGGNRDKSKRPMMGEVAAKMADVVFVTDDNPRNEDPAVIREEIMAKCPGAINIGDRHIAIKAAINQLSAGDTLLIAGKGHENYQIIKDEVIHFDDAEEVLNCIKMFSPEEINGVLNSSISNTIYGIAIDSRSVKKGDLFVAISGERFDGNNFVDQAIASGANAVICSRYEGKKENVIVVDDTIAALQKLGAYARKRYDTNIVGVTGSVGKSSTRHMLSLVLGHFSTTFSSIKNFNSQIGVPICLSLIPESANNAVIEMGMSHPGELKKLVDIARPDISIVTNVSESHQEFFENLSQIAMAKAEIFSNGAEQKYAIIPGDSACSEILINEAKRQGVKEIYTFGKDNILDVDFNSRTTAIEAKILDETVRYDLQTFNKGIIHNSLIPLLCAKLEGYSLGEAAQVLSEKFRPLPGRGQMFHLRGNSVLIDDAYNASPASMSEAISALNNYGANATKIAILGDMGELGDNAKQFHVAMADGLKSVDYVYLCGQNMLALHEVLPGSYWYEDIDALMRSLTIPRSSVILVKASRFMRFDKIVDFIRKGEI